MAPPVTPLFSHLINMLAACLLSLCVASPAIAEVHCAWDTATQFVDAARHASDHEPDGNTDGGDVERDSHCAFSHGHGDLAAGQLTPELPTLASPFTRPIAAVFVSSAPPGLDRPPRA